jgi:hypothetical protein
MVKRISILIISTFIITSCCYWGKTTEYGLPRRNIKGLGLTISYTGIDTMALYKSVYNFQYNTSTKKYSYLENEDDNTYPYISYMKFYSEGKFGLFVIPKRDTLDLKREFFNPLKAKMGYFTQDGTLLKTKLATIGDCTLYISKKSGSVNGDTIVLQDKRYHGSIYVKRQVSEELLKGWKPDW